MTRGSFGRSLSAAALAAFACAPQEKSGDVGKDLAPFALERLPDDAPHPTLIDFGSKIHLIGYDVSPEGTAAPGASVRCTLYWQRVGSIDPGWSFFTHLDDDIGRQLRNFDREGDFRKAVAGRPEGVAALQFGKVYKDDQTFAMPPAQNLTPRAALVVGVWDTDEAFKEMRLPVVSGPSDGHAGGLVVRFETGVTGQAVAQVAKRAAP